MDPRLSLVELLELLVPLGVEVEFYTELLPEFSIAASAESSLASLTGSVDVSVGVSVGTATMSVVSSKALVSIEESVLRWRA